jgi:[phosphatase 2A protein]-leucine-carboxy methyltransferase
MQKKELIMGTNDDALLSRISCINCGYIDDNFAKYFAKRSSTVRRAPVINRGTYTRIEGINSYIKSFLEHASLTNQSAQIISIGAGSDSRYFSLKSSVNSFQESMPKLYIEIDFAEITSKKAMAICRSKLRELLGPHEIGKGFS